MPRFDLRPNEKIILETHPSWYIVAGPIIGVFVLWIVYIIVRRFLPALFEILPPFLSALLPLVLVLITLVVLIGAVIEVTQYRYYLTDQRLVLTKVLFKKTVRELGPEKITDVMFSQKFLGRIFNYGTLTPLTAAAPDAWGVEVLEKRKLKKEFKLWSIPNPNDAQKKIRDSIQVIKEKPMRVEVVGIAKQLVGVEKPKEPAVRMEKADRYCVECGRAIPFDAVLCPYCGHKFKARELEPEKAPPKRMLDRKLLEYIAEHRGEISIPRASKKLGVSKREIKAALERLKRVGKVEEE